MLHHLLRQTSWTRHQKKANAKPEKLIHNHRRSMPDSNRESIFDWENNGQGASCRYHFAAKTGGDWNAAFTRQGAKTVRKCDLLDFQRAAA